MFGASCLYIKTFSQLGWQINFFDESNLFWNNQKMTQRFSNKNFSMASGNGLYNTSACIFLSFLYKSFFLYINIIKIFFILLL